MDWMDGMNLLGMVRTYDCWKKRGKVVVLSAAQAEKIYDTGPDRVRSFDSLDRSCTQFFSAHN
jgi:hypothetical protein